MSQRGWRPLAGATATILMVVSGAAGAQSDPDGLGNNDGSAAHHAAAADTSRIDRLLTAPSTVFLERNYIFNGFPRTGPAGQKHYLLLEGQIAPHFVMWETLGDKMAAGERAFAHSVSFTFMNRIRMLAEDSSPIRSPSYMPRFDYQLFWLRPDLDSRAARARQVAARVRVADCDATHGPCAPEDRALATAPDAEARVVLWALRLTPFAHHSNGQEGCRFKDPNGVCLSGPDAAADLSRINRVNGDFSTNYVVLGVNGQSMTLDRNDFVARGWGGAAAFEYHPQTLFGSDVGFGPGHIDAELQHLYGRARLRVEASYQEEVLPGCAFEGRARLDAGYERTLGADPRVPSNRAWVEASWASFRRRGFGAFTRLYWGQDYYNLLFVDEITQVQFGMMFDVEKPLRFGPG
jgi:hypothetical protein